MTVLSIAELEALARTALAGSGAGDPVAEVMAQALVAAEARGNAGVGLAHLVTYCDALRDGRIDGHAEPVVARPAPALVKVDARGGVGHLAYAREIDRFAEAARSLGVSIFSQSNSYTNAGLDWFVEQLAERGLVGLAATNAGPPVLAASGSKTPVFCTNPLAFAAPIQDGPPLLIDQSSSSTAIVNLHLAAERGEPIPEGWALGPDGHPTTDPLAALKGVMLAFGGARGANVALMVEVMAAGLSGAHWSLDADSFIDGPDSPRIGLFVLALDPDALLGADFSERLAAYAERISAEHGAYIPGRRRAEAARSSAADGIDVPDAMLDRLKALSQGRS